MKNILYTISAVILFASCKKDEDCYQCSVTNTYTMVTTTNDQKWCGWDATDASAYETKQTEMNKFVIGGKTYYRRTNCYVVK